MPGRRVPPPGSSAAGCAPALPQGDAAEGRRGSRPPCPALPCPARPCPAQPGPARPGLQGQARVRLQREMPAVRDAGRGEEAARGTAALRNHPHTPPPPVARPPCGRAASRLSHGSCRHPHKGFRESLHFHFGPAKRLPGAAAPDRSSRSEGLTRCPAPFPAPEGDEGQSSARSASLVGVRARCSGMLLGAALLLSTFLSRFK